MQRASQPVLNEEREPRQTVCHLLPLPLDKLAAGSMEQNIRFRKSVFCLPTGSEILGSEPFYCFSGGLMCHSVEITRETDSLAGYALPATRAL